MFDRREAMVGAAALALAGRPAWGADINGPALKSDIAILRRAYALLHPGLYRYASPAEIAARFDALESEFAQGPARAQAYLALSRFLASIRCGHSYANFYNQSDKVVAELFSGRNRLPFYFSWAGERMIVTRNQSNDARLKPGSEILEIDGRAPAKILRELMLYVRADGGNDAKRRALLEVSGIDRFETFDIFFGLLFPPRNGAFRLSVRAPGSAAAQTIEAKALDLAERRAAMPPESSDNARPLWTLTYPRARTALLTMPNWAVYNSKWNWQAFLDDAFADFAKRNTRGLIVDLRANEGGNDCGNEITARLIDKDMPFESYERRVRYRRTPADLDRYLDTWDDSFKTLGEGATDLGNGFYRLEPEAGGEDGQLIRAKGPRFRGEVVVLTSAQNSSATFQFAQCIQTNRLGRLIGAPTGGNQRGINGGAFFFLRLPASGLEVDLPLIGRFSTAPKPDAGLTPDILVTPTVDDIAAGRDRVLETAVGLLARA